ncbi:MAG TPA: DNA-directed RNA polymerase subunit A' [Candidatus Nanoarchaeia archaeon]|nr:DNA-directed RNA polymerase subunit A' [Candidatus Nanoarchaeia archaeon]
MAEEYVYKCVDSIEFGLLGPEEIQKMSAVKVVTPELYDNEGYPVDGGLMDIRLGVIDPGLRCKTCGGKLKECMGHFGYIELARPVIHIKYIKVILDCLRSACRECGKVLLQDKDQEKWRGRINKAYAEGREDAKRDIISLLITSVKNIRKCPHCKAKQYSIKIEKPSTLMENDRRLTPIEIRTRLERVSNEDLFFLGLDAKAARPEWSVLTLISIPPVTMRPSITLETGERSEDDLTHKLGDVVRINQRLFENINAGAPEIIVEDLWDLLQYHVTTYLDNTISQVPPARHRSGQALKTLTERIKSKEGRFRHNLAGKRVNYAARTVISPDPRIKFNEVGIPQRVALELTVPERVNEWNIEKLKELIKRGAEAYPGANYVVRPDGKKKQITDESREVILNEIGPGMIVERHLVDGDIALFNRQPSLHRMSIMCHRIRVLPGKSFRLNPSVCNAFNADFDGDEMNLHIPQTEEARAEAEILMEVQTQMITPKHGYNVMGCVEDSVTGLYLLTKGEGMQLTREDATQLMVSIGIEDPKIAKQKINGKELFSMLLPKDFNYEGLAKGTPKDAVLKLGDDGLVRIEDGQLVSGVIDSNAIGEERGKMIMEFYRRYGPSITVEFLGNIFRLGIKILLKRGFTISIDNIDVSREVQEKINASIAQGDKEVDEVVKEYRAGKMDALPGRTLAETLEIKTLGVLNKIRDKIGQYVAQSTRSRNSAVIMARSGARGKILNLAQMSGCVGQQALMGHRITTGYKGRTLSMFKKDDLSADAHGFVKNSFKRGLNPYEFFFHAMTGRDGLMDTALRTPKSGYLYRRLANALQDMKVEYDNSVRDANKNVVQFSYGEDGLEVSKTWGGTLNIRNIVKSVKHEK